MIKVEELRIGNWVNVRGIAYTVNGSFLAEIEKKNCTWKKDVEPVPLSPGLLEKCGFKQSSFTQYEFKEFRITALDSIDENGPYKLLFGFKGTIECIEVQHLHQLQNLVFVLTGSELAVNL